MEREECEDGGPLALLEPLSEEPPPTSEPERNGDVTTAAQRSILSEQPFASTLSSSSSSSSSSNTDQRKSKGKEKVDVEEQEPQELLLEEGEAEEWEAPEGVSTSTVYDIVLLDARNVKQPWDALSYTVYDVALYTLASKKPIVVSKRFSEFVAFHDALKAAFPTAKVPVFPSKSLLTPKMDPTLIELRKLELEEYLRELLSLSKEQQQQQQIQQRKRRGSGNEAEASAEGDVPSAGVNFWDSFYTKLFLEAYDLHEKVVIITGGASGLGLAAAKVLATLKARVILAIRSPESASSIIEQIQKETKNTNVEAMQLDLSSLASVRSFVEAFKAKDLPLHLLINNAAMLGIRGLSEDGFELHLASNYLGHFLLTNLLLESLEQGGGSSRIINVSCKVHMNVTGPVNWSAVAREPCANGPRGLLAAYEKSKLANAMFTRELSKRLRGRPITVFTADPGVIASGLWRNLPGPLAWMMKKVMTSEERAVTTLLYCAISEEAMKLPSGTYCEKCAEGTPSPIVDDKDQTSSLWQLSEEWSGLLSGSSTTTTVASTADADDDITNEPL